MGRKVKKPAKNGFSFFLEEYIDSLKYEGRYISRRIGAEECGPLWEQLPDDQKKKYIKLADASKALSKQDKKNKFTSFGVSYEELERKQEELRLKTEKADREIKITIFNLDSDLLKMHLFYIVHCNYYCKTDEGMYVPGEIAIAEFNLEDGVRRKFHTLVDPGSIPLGFAYEAKQTIDEIHGLPYPPYGEGESDYFGILEEILEFLEPGRLSDGRYPPLYCIDNNIQASENILQFLSDNKAESSDYFRVYHLTKMFFRLKNKCVEYLEDENLGFPVLSNAESEISKDVFCYVPGISCSYHEKSEFKYQSCSLSVVQRLAYVICDHCCQHIGVELVPGKHCRLGCDTDRKATLSKIEKSSRRDRASPPRSKFEYDEQSSFADDFSCFDWKRGYRGSFLDDEMGSNLSSYEVSSFCSRSTRRDPGSNYGRSRRRARGEEPVDEFEEDFKSALSLGRGASFR